MNMADLHRHGITVTLDGDRLKLKAPEAPPAVVIDQIHAHKAQLIDELKTQTLRAALTRLELGETPAVRIRINDHEQVLILQDDEIPESITVDCPTFTLTELKRLIGARPWQIARLYELKIGDLTMRVTQAEEMREKS